MRTKDYPYGATTKTLRKAVKWLNAKMRGRTNLGVLYFEEFDYPDHWGMPKTISSRLSSDQVDWIQSEICDVLYN
jgi:hypothetical protein